MEISEAAHKNSIRFSLFINGLLLIVILFVISHLLSFVQRHYIPIVEYINVHHVYHDDDYNHDISGVLKKSKWAPPWVCSFNRINASMLTPVGWERIAIEYYDQPKNSSVTRNPGESVFGQWKLKTANQPDAREVQLDIHHNCLALPLPASLGFELYFMKARTTILLDLDSETH